MPCISLPTPPQGIEIFSTSRSADIDRPLLLSFSSLQDTLDPVHPCFILIVHWRLQRQVKPLAPLYDLAPASSVL